MMRAVVFPLIASLVSTMCFAAGAKVVKDTNVTIAMSSTAATGITVGIALVGVLIFAVGMMQGIQISDTITESATEAS
ncbi:hypothetical protein LSCM1_00671 [Leishmania martiniquensis]|uniref:Uncharacterized protein n=1 Tax=Leishmania martiniquensis TaxID=1580590 RepID=A0A836K8Y7_9TRYP|nr:hypothetical protein LSCM1_00671 [Leishmania martiniquensis]